MLVIRFRRVGKKNKPSYRIVVSEHSYPVNGKYTADLGFYNPHTKETKFDDKVMAEWLNKGAKPSNSVAKLLEKAKIKHKSVVVVKKSSKPKTQAEEAAKAAKTAPEAASTEILEATDTAAEQPTQEAPAESTEEPKEELPAEEPAVEEKTQEAPAE